MKQPTFLAELCARWRTQAEMMRRYGADTHADTLDACADELEAAEREYLFAELTPDEAAEEFGQHPETVRRKIRSGELPNTGKRNRPRTVRAALMPNAPDLGPLPMTDHGEPDVAEEILRGRS